MVGVWGCVCVRVRARGPEGWEDEHPGTEIGVEKRTTRHATAAGVTGASRARDMQPRDCTRG